MKTLILLPAIALLFASCAKDEAIAPKASQGKFAFSEAVALREQFAEALPNSSGGNIVSSEAVALREQFAEALPNSSGGNIVSSEAVALREQFAEALPTSSGGNIVSSEAVALREQFAEALPNSSGGKVVSSEAGTASNASDRAAVRCDVAIHALLNAQWRLQALDGQLINLPAGAARPWVKLSDAHGYHLNGFGGCNTLVGSFVPGCGTLQFTDLARTHIYCTSTVGLEDQLLAALSVTDAFAIEGNNLILLAGGEEVARFSSQNWSDIPAMQNEISAVPPVHTPPTVPVLID